MSRVQLALRVSDLEGSIAFYSSLFGEEPAKRRPGYANFAITEPPLKLVLIEGQADQPTVMDHLGVEVETTGEVNAATGRLSELGLFTQVENDTSCCYALQTRCGCMVPAPRRGRSTPSRPTPRRPASSTPATDLTPPGAGAVPPLTAMASNSRPAAEPPPPLVPTVDQPNRSGSITAD
jgi:catechol 2,3-dioxygenase-like lactoylglutathione lyase family enzyme